jgi:DNA-binding winged helix-turn-helix (wHTH) protein/tetratricopeptide (TPR) repeat protein
MSHPPEMARKWGCWAPARLLDSSFHSPRKVPMSASSLNGGILRFGVFEADLRSGELRKNGAKVKIQELPFRALRLLLSRPQEVLTREELRKALWPDGVFVDFDHGISSAINRLRDALGDSADNPIFVETVERRGYRWIAPIHGLQLVARTEDEVKAQEPAPPVRPEPSSSRTWSQAGRKLVWGLPVLALVFATWLFRHTAHPTDADASRGAASLLSATAHHPANPEAEDFYLKGRFYWNQRTPEALTKAVDYFTQSIVHDPGYAKAYVGLADCYNLLREYSLMPSNEAYPRALASARRAVELDDRSSDAHASLAFASFYGMWDVATADREFRRAIELDPKNACAHHWYATYLMTLGRPSEALAEIDRARELDPSSAAILADKGDILIAAGKSEEGISLLKQMETTEPSFISPHRYLKMAYLDRGENAAYVTEARQEAVLLKDPVGLAIATAAQQGLSSGGSQGMLSNIRTVEKKYYEQGRFSPLELAETCSRLGNQQEALHYLQSAFDQHDESIIALEVDSAFKELHNQPAYRTLLARAGLPVQP